MITSKWYFDINQYKISFLGQIKMVFGTKLTSNTRLNPSGLYLALEKALWPLLFLILHYLKRKEKNCSLNFLFLFSSLTLINVKHITKLLLADFKLKTFRLFVFF